MYLLMQRHYDISKGTLCQQTKRCRPSSFDFKVRDATEVNDRDELRGVNGEVLYRVEVSYSEMKRNGARASFMNLVR
jgi:hypothetical protein